MLKKVGAQICYTSGSRKWKWHRGDTVDLFEVLIQILVVSGLIYIVSGRLIGSNINFVRRVLSVVISVTLTSFVYWYSYLRHTDFCQKR